MITQELIDALAAQSVDQTKASEAFENKLTPAGKCMLRFNAYIELGVQKFDNKQNPARDTRNEINLAFEVHGGNYPVSKIVTSLGETILIPHRTTTTISTSQDPKSNLFALMTIMNWQKRATHLSQLLGEAFLGEIKHFTNLTGKVLANLRNEANTGYTITPPTVSIPDSAGNFSTQIVNVPAMIEERRLFLWNAPPELFAPMWKSIEQDKDRNPPAPGEKFFPTPQMKIKSALNFKGSPIENWLMTQGLPLVPPIPPAEIQEAPVAKDAPLEGLE